MYMVKDKTVRITDARKRLAHQLPDPTIALAGSLKMCIRDRISSFTGEAAMDTESRREAAAIRYTDGERPGDSNGGETGDRADL